MAGSGIGSSHRAGMRAVGGAAASVLLAGGLAVAGAQPARATEIPGDWRPPDIEILINRVEQQAEEPREIGIESVTTTSTRSSAPKDGSFVAYDGRIFRIVGGAAWYVSSWKVYGGPKPYRKLTDEQFDALDGYPADGTFVQTAQDRRVYRIVGGAPVYVSTWAAFGGRRQHAIRVDQVTMDRSAAADPDFEYPVVTRAPLDLVATRDGRVAMDTKLYVKGGQTGKIYKVLGGSFQYIRSWAPYGGPKPTITVDQVTIDRAGEDHGPFRFVSRYPLDNWLLQLGETGELFVMAGGAPVYVATPSFAHTWFGGLVPARVDPVMLEALRAVPADDTMLLGLPEAPHDGVLTDLEASTYKVTAGVPALQQHGNLIDIVNDSGRDLAMVDQVAIDRAGQGGVFDHLLASPDS